MNLTKRRERIILTLVLSRKIVVLKRFSVRVYYCTIQFIVGSYVYYKYTYLI